MTIQSTPKKRIQKTNSTQNKGRTQTHGCKRCRQSQRQVQLSPQPEKRLDLASARIGGHVQMGFDPGLQR